MHLYFSDFVNVFHNPLDRYGEFNISLVTDLPPSGNDFGYAGMIDIGVSPAGLSLSRVDNDEI